MLRPLLDMTRTEIESYLQREHILYRNDSTNEDTAYTRNYIRKELFPLLEQRLNRQAVRHLAEMAGDARQWRDYVERQAAPVAGRKELLPPSISTIFTDGTAHTKENSVRSPPSSRAGHRKKLNRYYIDRKIPLQERERQLVLAEGNKVLWAIPGRHMSQISQRPPAVNNIFNNQNFPTL